MNQVVQIQPRPKSVTVDMADRFGMEAAAFEQTLRATVFPGNGTKEQFAAFLLVAKQYDLNPITKEIYAFPAKGGGIVPVVSIDGWLKLINSHPQFDGMEFEDGHDEKGDLFSTKCTLWRKDRSKAVIVTEYLSECHRPTDPWKMKHRMLRHKSLIQCARYAFGFAGIVDPDDGELLAEPGAGRPQARLTPPRPTPPNPNKPAPTPPQPEQSSPAAFSFDAFRALLDSAATNQEANEIYDREVTNRIPPLLGDEMDECDALLRECTSKFYVPEE